MQTKRVLVTGGAGFIGSNLTNGEAPELFGDGSQTRDFTNVSDVACACELAADHAITGVYNVGTQ